MSGSPDASLSGGLQVACDNRALCLIAISYGLKHWGQFLVLAADGRVHLW